MTAAGLLVLAIVLALPQAPRRERPPGEEAAKMVDAYIVGNLQESLGLTDEQFVKLLPLVKKLQTGRREAVLGRMRAVRELRRLLGSGKGTEAQVLDRLAEVKRLESEGQDRIRADLESIDAALTPLQQAKFRVLEADVERRIREILGEMRRQRRGTSGRPASPDEP